PPSRGLLEVRPALLRAGRQGLSDRRDRLHRRPSSFGHARGGARTLPDRPRVRADRRPSRYRARVRASRAIDRLAFCSAVHTPQPIGNFDHVMVEATERAYRPFLERLDRRPEVRLTVHCTGSLLEWLRERAPRVFDLLGTLAARGQVELLT